MLLHWSFENKKNFHEFWLSNCINLTDATALWLRCIESESNAQHIWIQMCWALDEIVSRLSKQPILVFWFLVDFLFKTNPRRSFKVIFYFFSWCSNQLPLWWKVVDLSFNISISLNHQNGLLLIVWAKCLDCNYLVCLSMICGVFQMNLTIFCRHHGDHDLSCETFYDLCGGDHWN